MKTYFQKKLFFFFSFFALIGIKIEAEEFLLEGKAGYFFPLDSRFCDVYSGSGIYGLEMSLETFHCFYAWASASVFVKSGNSIGNKTPTKIYLVPFGVGLKYLFPVYCDCIDMYLGAGVLPTFLHIDDESPFVLFPVEKWGVGGIFKAGSLIRFCNCFFIDLFVDYTILQMKFRDSSIPVVIRDKAELDGVTIGGGIGYSF